MFFGARLAFAATAHARTHARMQAIFDAHEKVGRQALGRARLAGAGDVWRRLVPDSAEPEVVFHPTQRVFRAGGRAVPGLTDSLRAIFWPDYDYYAAMRAARRLAGSGGVSGGGGGLHLGTLVHSEVHEFVNHGLLARVRGGGDQYTRTLFEMIDANGWLPVQAELPVLMHELGCATAIDLVCVARRTAQLVFIEIKTGYDNAWMRSTARMQAPLRFLTNAPVNQAHVQNAIAVYCLLRRARLPLSAVRMCVANINTQGVTLQFAPDSLVHMVPAAYLRMRGALCPHADAPVRRYAARARTPIAKRRKRKKRNRA